MNFYIGISIVLLFSLNSQARNFGGIAGSPLDNSGSQNETDAQKPEQSQPDVSSLNAGDSGSDSSGSPGSSLVSPWSEWMKLKAPPAAFLKPKKKTFPFMPVQPVSSAEELAAASPWAQWAKLKTATAAASIPSFPPSSGAPLASPIPGITAGLSPWAAWTSVEPPAFASIPSPAGLAPQSSASSPTSPVVAPWAAWAQLKAATAAGNVPSLKSPFAASSLLSKELPPKRADDAPAAIQTEQASLASPTSEIPRRPVTMEDYIPQLTENKLPVNISPEQQMPANLPLNSWPAPATETPNAPYPAYFQSYSPLLPNNAAPARPAPMNSELFPPQSTLPILNSPYTFNPYNMVPSASIPAPAVEAVQPVISPPFPFQFPVNTGNVYPASPYFTIPANYAPETPPDTPLLVSDVSYPQVNPMGLLPVVPQSAEAPAESPNSVLLQEEEALEPALLEYLKTLGIKVPEPEASISVASPVSPGIPPINPFLPASIPIGSAVGLPEVSPETPGVPPLYKNVSSVPPSSTPIPLEAAEEKLLVKWAKKIFDLQKNNSWVPSTKTPILESAWAEWVSLQNNATLNSTNTATPTVPVVPGETVDKDSLVAWLKEIGVFPVETKKMAELVKWIEEIEKPAKSPFAPVIPVQIVGQTPLPHPSPELSPEVILSVNEILSKAPPAEKLRISAWIAANNLTIPTSPASPGPFPSLPKPESVPITSPSAPGIPVATAPPTVLAKSALPESPIPPNVVDAVNAAYPSLPPEQKLQIALWTVANNVTLPSIAATDKPVASSLVSPIPPFVIQAVETLYPTAPAEKKLEIATWIVTNNVTIPQVPPTESLAPSLLPASPEIPSISPISPLPLNPSSSNNTTIPPLVVTAINTMYPSATPEKKLEIASWIVANNITIPPSVISPTLLPSESTPPPPPSPLGTPIIPPSVVAIVKTLYPATLPDKQLEIATWIVTNNVTIPQVPPTEVSSSPAAIPTNSLLPLNPSSLLNTTTIPASLVTAINTIYPSATPEKKLEIASWIVANNLSLTLPSPVPSSALSPELSPPSVSQVSPVNMPVVPPGPSPLESIPSIPPSLVEAINTAYPTLTPEQKLQIAIGMMKTANTTSPATSPAGLPATISEPSFIAPPTPTLPAEGIPQLPHSVIQAIETLYPTAPVETKLQIAAWMISNNITSLNPPAPIVSIPSFTSQEEVTTGNIPPTEIPLLPPYLEALQEILPTLPEESKTKIEAWLAENEIILPPSPGIPISPPVAPVPVPVVGYPYPPPLPSTVFYPPTSQITIPEKLSPFKAEIEEILLRGPPDIKSQLITWLVANNVSVTELSPLSPAFPAPISSYPSPPWVKYLNPVPASPLTPYPMGPPAIIPTENPLMLPPLEQLSPTQFKALLQEVLEKCNKSTVMVPRSSNSKASVKNRKKHHRNTKKDSVEVVSSEEEENKTEEAEKVVSAMRRALYPTAPETLPSLTVVTPKPSKLDFVPQEFWDMVPTLAPNTSLVDPGYWAAKKSMFISKLFDALARVTLNYTNSATSTTTEDPKQQLLKKMDTQLLSNAARSVKDSEEEESAETSTDDEDLISSKEPENLPKEPENPLHKLFKFGVQKTILSDLSTTPSPNDQPFREPPTTPTTTAPKNAPGLDEQKELLNKLKSVLNHAKKTHRKAVKKQKSKSNKSRGSTTTTESPIDFEALAKALLVQPSK